MKYLALIKIWVETQEYDMETEFYQRNRNVLDFW